LEYKLEGRRKRRPFYLREETLSQRFDNKFLLATARLETHGEALKHGALFFQRF
jgi:hypothetical protein